MNAALTGTAHLARLILRRDRIRLPLWVIGLGGTIAWSAAAVPSIYDTPAKVAGYAASVGASPVSHLMSGRQAGIDTVGGITANEISQVAQIGIGLMAMFLVIRHTRAEEESGRAEMLRSTVLGRHAATLAALGYGTLATLAIGLVTTLSLLGVGLDAAGSVAYGVGLALLGACCAAVSLVAAQLSTSARGALGLAGGMIAAAYLVRGIGAVQDNALVWLSPFGWAQLMNAFGAERWWPAGLLVAGTGILLALAARLNGSRDFGGGLVQTRPGSPRATARLGTPLGLTLRLQRGSLVGWAAGLGTLALIYGSVIPTVPDLLSSNPDIGGYLGVTEGAEQALVDAFLRFVLLFMAVVSTGYAVSSVMRLRSEEESSRTESVLATPVSRTAWTVATLAVTVAGSALLLLLAGAGLATGWVVGGGTWDEAAPVILAQLTHLPAVLVVAGFALALVGLRPGWSPVAWALVAAICLQAMLGEVLGLPDAVEAISPFWHLPGVPEQDLGLLPGLVELVVAASLVLIGLWGFRRRDVQAG